MPDITEDARRVQDHIDRIFDADPRDRAEAIRRLFVEVLDFHGAVGQVSLAGAAKGAELPDFAERIASLDGVQVLWVALATKRVNKREAAEAARLIERDLGEDILLVFTNGDASQLHLILPDFTSGTVPKLRRRTVERGLPQRTAYEQIAGIYSVDEPLPVRQALKKAFDVEPVTRDFFRKYDELFKAAKGLVTGIEGEERHLFVQTLFNRLLFVHFLSRKGWLTFEDDKDYLKALWRDYQATEGETNFHRDRLRRLFFDGLSNPESRIRDYPDIGKVPFLNGGLFEETDLDKREGVIVPNAAIEPLLNDLFGTFNFTVMESTPFDVEVAVDPEMLGKVFEELVTGRHESGSYYTPRPVVSFMCREALKGYLEGATGLDATAIARFVDDHDESGIPRSEAFAVSDALHAVTVVDPACGSGAYLLGMMQELVELWAVLYSDRLKNDAREHYDLKLDIIQRNLYGVDSDEFAANIAMLRLWLSLSIDYDGADEPPPLPNLDFKIVCGDSLLGPDPSQISFNSVAIEQSGLGALKADYLRASEGVVKDRLRAEIAVAREQVRTDLAGATVPTGVVDWGLEFAEVFASRGGFDIAIANPPYVRMEQIKSVKQQLAALYPDVYTGRADYFVYFFRRAVQSLRDGGVLAFITSNAYMRAGYGKKLREFLSSRLTLRQVVDFTDLPVFAATVDTTILVGSKQGVPSEHRLQIADLGPPVSKDVAAEGLPLNTQAVGRAMDRLPVLLDRHTISSYPQSMLRNDGWILEHPALVGLFEHLMDRGSPLGEVVGGRIYMGIKTGLNPAFVIDRDKRDELIEADHRSEELLRPWLRGRDIRKWRADWAGLWIIFARRGVDIDHYPAIKEHLGAFRPALEQRATAGLHPWYELQQPQEGIFAEFERPKVVWPDIAREMRFAQVVAGTYLNNKAYFTPAAETWLLPLLNSNMMEFLVRQLTNALRGGAIQGHIQYMTRLPIVTPDVRLQRRLKKITDVGTAGEPVDTEELNDLVYDLYGLSRADRALIRDWFERRSLVE